jgi:hypothetical protein
VSTAELGSYTTSDLTDMLLILTVSEREIIVIVHVALKRGSSQHGNAALASVAYKQLKPQVFLATSKNTYLEVG